MALAEAIILARYRNWRVFGTGTFSGSSGLSAIARRKLTLAFLRKSSKVARVPFHRLVWCLRFEFGEIGGRGHYHWLMGSSSWEPNLSQCFTLNQTWDALPKCGFSRNHIFDQRLNGVEYVTKCLTQLDTIGGDLYESRKFQQDGSCLTLSNSFFRAVGGRRVVVLKTGELCTGDKISNVNRA